jgi:C1A family cysteine protease
VRAATTNIDLYDLSDDQIKETLYSYGPIVVGISSVGWSSYSSGVFECNPADTIDHAVLAVGWTSNAWIIKNQWSDNWGDDGYIYLSM